MKLLVSLLCQMIVCANLAQSSQRVREMTLNPEVSLSIPVARDRLTTIRFPSPPTALEGLFLAPEPEPSALFQMSFRPGNSFFSVRALVAEAKSNLNVIWKGRTYVLELFESDEPLLSVILKEASPVVPLTRPPTPARRTPDTARLAQLVSLVASRRPGETSTLPSSAEATLLNLRWQFTHYDLLLREIVRFPEDDTLVFCVLLRNKSKSALTCNPRSFAMVASRHFWTPSYFQAEGSVPPKAEGALFFAVTGGVNGVPAQPGMTNEFRVITGEISVDAPRGRSWFRRLFRL